MKCAANFTNCIIESSGTSWRLKPRILEHPTIRKRGVLTIVFHGREEDFLKRLKDRKESKTKQRVPFKYKGLSEEGLVAYALEQLPKRFPEATYIITDETVDIEEVYQKFSETVKHFLLYSKHE